MNFYDIVNVLMIIYLFLVLCIVASFTLFFLEKYFKQNYNKKSLDNLIINIVNCLGVLSALLFFVFQYVLILSKIKIYVILIYKLFVAFIINVSLFIFIPFVFNYIKYSIIHNKIKVNKTLIKKLLKDKNFRKNNDSDLNIFSLRFLIILLFIYVIILFLFPNTF